MFRTTFVVGPNRRLSDIISMIVFNLKVICCLRTFQQLMLDLFDNNILAVEHDEDITGSEVNCACPTLDRRIERMHRRTGNLLTVHLYMNPFLNLIWGNCTISRELFLLQGCRL